VSNIHIGTINLRELDKKIRRSSFPRQTEKVHSSPSGKRGYDRKRAKQAWQKGDS